MKPKPLASLNHFTVSVAIVGFSYRDVSVPVAVGVCSGGGVGGRGCRPKLSGFGGRLEGRVPALVESAPAPRLDEPREPRRRSSAGIPAAAATARRAAGRRGGQ